MSRPAALSPFVFDRSDRRGVVLVGLLGLVQAGLTLPSLLVVRRMLDLEGNSAGEALLWGLALAGLVGAGVVVQEYARFLGLRVMRHAVRRVRRALAVRLSSIRREELSHGDLDQVHTDVVFATERYERSMAAVLSGLVPGVVVVVVVGAGLVVLAPVMALTFAVCASPAFLLGRRRRTGVAEAHRAYSRALGKYSGGVSDALRLRDLISAHGAEAAMTARLWRDGDAAGERQFEAQRAHLRFVSGQQVIYGAAGALALGIGAAIITQGSDRTRDLVTVVAAFGLIQGNLRNVTSAVPHVVDGQTVRGILEEFLGEPVAVPDEPPADPAPTAGPTGRVWEVCGLVFRYEPDAPEVLAGVDLRLERGTITGIVGPNGSGKTTLVSLLMGWYEPMAGDISIDGVPYDRLGVDAVRRQVGLVPQEPEFLDATVRDNLVLGLSPPPGADALERVLAVTTADQVVASRPGGLDAPMGRDGRRYSGGQRQRLAIARAVLRHPALLIVDEPTNHLDPTSASTILGNLRAAPEAWSVLVVSHDPAVLAICDQVYRLDGGRLHPVAR